MYLILFFDLFSYVFCFYCMLFFFFKQKTAYEMRISDWSSDVCSSDLHSGLMNASCSPGRGSLSAMTYNSSPIGPMYSVTSTNPHFITAGSGLPVNWSHAT